MTAGMVRELARKNQMIAALRAQIEECDAAIARLNAILAAERAEDDARIARNETRLARAVAAAHAEAQAAVASAVADLAARDTDLRILRMQVAHLAGFLRGHADSFVDADAVASALAGLESIAREERGRV